MAGPLSALVQLIGRHNVTQAMPTAPPNTPQATAPPAAQSAPAEDTQSHPADLYSDPHALMAGLIRNGVPPQYAIQHVQAVLDLNKQLEGYNAEKLGNMQKRYGEAGQTVIGYLDNPTPAAWSATYNKLKAIDPEIAGGAPDPAQTPNPTEAQLSPLLAVTAAHGLLVSRKKTEAETAEANATAANTQAKTPGEIADAETKQFKLDLLKHAAGGTAPDFGATVKSMSVFSGHPQEAQDAADAGTQAYRAALASGDPLAAATEANKAVSAVADRLRAVSPGVVAGEAGKAKATAQATLPVEQAKAQYQNALQQGDKATADYASTIADSRQTTATAQTIHKVIDLAQGDNATAGAQLKALIPEFTNAIQDIKRPGNAQSSEIASTLEKAKGEIESGAGLSPLTAKSLADIRPYVDTVTNGAVTRANTAIDATNTAYGKKFAHETLPVQYQQNAQTGQIIVTRDGGSTWADSKTGKPVK